MIEYGCHIWIHVLCIVRKEEKKKKTGHPRAGQRKKSKTDGEQLCARVQCVRVAINASPQSRVAYPSSVRVPCPHPVCINRAKSRDDRGKPEINSA